MKHTQKTTGLIRMAIMGTAFVALTVVLLVFQPGSPRHASGTALPETSVPRVAAPLDSVVNAPADVSGSGVSFTDVAQQPVAPSSAALSMRDITFGAISNLKSATTGEAPAPGEPGSLLHSVVQRSIAGEPVQTSPVVQPEPVAAKPVRKSVSDKYFVRPGDTLGSIAQEVYGDAGMASEIFLKNTNIMSRPESLRAGMILDLP